MIGQRPSSEIVFLTLPKDSLYKGRSDFRRGVASADAAHMSRMASEIPRKPREIRTARRLGDWKKSPAFALLLAGYRARAGLHMHLPGM